MPAATGTGAVTVYVTTFVARTAVPAPIPLTVPTVSVVPVVPVGTVMVTRVIVAAVAVVMAYV